MYTEAYQLAEKIYKALDRKSALEITTIDVSELTSLTEVFVIATASNVKQVQALADEVEESLEKEGKGWMLARKEGYDTAKWILLDYSNVIVHILYKEDAEFYRLDKLWHDGTMVEFA